MSYNSVPERYVTCPYNKYHQILLSRLQFHLVKCKKVYTGEVKLVQCPFNSTHLIPEIEMNCHKMYSCPDRNKLETFIVATEDTAPLFKVKPIEMESNENWEDVYCPSYNPMEKCKNKPVLIHIQCAPRSVRKQLRSEERERLDKLSGINSNETSQQSRPTSSVRLPQTIPNTYFDRNAQVATENSGTPGVTANIGTIPKAFGRGRGRVLK